MQERPGLMLLTVRAGFAEAAKCARRLAELSGIGVMVARGSEGFSVWVPAESHAQLSAVLQEFDAGVVETRGDEDDARLEPEIEDDGADYEFEDEAASDYQKEVWSEIMDDIEDDRNNWAASEEDGWFYPD